jgi:hypothetical protein
VAVARARQASDWEVDLAAARALEQQVYQLLVGDPRLRELEDNTGSFAELDFSFAFNGRPITLDVKEKRQPYSTGVRRLWEEVAENNLFIVDETVFRRVVWQGGGGFPCYTRRAGPSVVLLRPLGAHPGQPSALREVGPAT